MLRLEDLAPREPVTGGAGKVLFGERREPGPRPDAGDGRESKLDPEA